MMISNTVNNKETELILFLDASLVLQVSNISRMFLISEENESLKAHSSENHSF